MHSMTITNALIITPQEVLKDTSLFIKDGKIAAINQKVPEHSEIVIDAKGSVLIPGIIDIHTDALDAEIIPRPGADIPIMVAFKELERKMSGCGITTVYHSLHLGYDKAEFTSRSKYSREEVFATVNKAINGKTILHNKIHLRYELTGVYAYETCFDLIEKGYVGMLSVMDHTPGQGQYTKELYVDMMMKTGKNLEQSLADYENMIKLPKIEGERLERLVHFAVSKGIPVASHDDDTIEKVNTMHQMGINICEFPINLKTAHHATKLGMHVVGGASNILRGGSLSGNLNIKDAVLEGAVNSLCSDYYPAALLHSVFKLNEEYGLDFCSAINLATIQAARAAKIDHLTGSIEVGKFADLIIIDREGSVPMVNYTIVNGELVVSARNKNSSQVKQEQPSSSINEN